MSFNLWAVPSAAVPPGEEEWEGRALFSSRTATYTLAPGDTVETVAKKYGMTVAQLKKLNMFRSYSKPFSELTTGDDVDVPVTRPAGTDRQAAPSAPADPDILWAQGASRLGAMAVSDTSMSDSATRMATGVASQAATRSAEQWLSQFGTAKVNLGFDERFGLDGSSLDMLVPLYDNQKSMLFTQFGARNKDDRNTLNLGAGVRHFTDNGWMFGGNAFLDNDITGNNRRVGLGAEAWTDYLKLSANQYFSITDWHQSRDFADYDERPANGYDLRAEAYLPAYPQLGGSLMYEKYRGDEVALFGKDNLQSDPYAITAGLTYTPVPLVTAGVEHRVGKGGQDDTQFTLEFNYQLGTPWGEQTDTGRVAAHRSLAGSRTGLVERNNNIVMEYKKQELVTLSLPETLSGNAGDTITLSATVQGKYGVDRVEWDTAAFQLAGGRVVETSKTALALTLPPYQAGRSAVPNEHLISAVAYDARGNHSPRDTTRIQVSPAQAQLKPLQVSGDGAVADGNATVQVTATVVDPQTQLPLSGERVTFSSSDSNMMVTDPHGGQGETNAQGQITASVVSAAAGTYTLSARLDGGSEQSVSVNFIAGDVSEGKSTFTVDDTEIEAGSQESATLTLLAYDSNGNPVTGLATGKARSLSLSFSVEGISAGGYELSTISESDTAPGEYRATLKGTQAGTATIRPVVDGNRLGDLNVQVTLKGGAVDTGQSVFDAPAPGSIVTNGQTSTLTVHLKDAQGNALPGKAPGLQVAVAGVTGTQVSPFSESTTAGTYTATISGTQAGTATLTASSDGAVLNPTQTLTLTADTNTAAVRRLSAEPPVQIAGQPVTLTAEVEDAHGNRVPAVDVEFLTGGSAVLSAGSAQTDADGNVEVTLNDTTAESVGVVARTPTESTGQNITVEFTQTVVNATVTELVADQRGPLSNDSTYTLTATLKDSQGSVLPGQKVIFSSGDPKVTIIPLNEGKTDANGQATATLGSTGIAPVTVQAKAPNMTDRGQILVREFTAGKPVASKSSVSITPDNIPVNTTGTVTTILEDQYGNPVEGMNVTFEVTGAGAQGAVDILATTDAGNGQYTAAVTGRVPATGLRIQPVPGGTPMISMSASFNVIPGAVAGGVLSGPSEMVANNSVDTVTFKATDGGGNPVPGIADELTFNIINVTGQENATVGSVTESDTAGTYTATLTSGTKAGSIRIAAHRNGTAILGVTPLTVVLNAGDPDPTKSTFVSSTPRIVANGQDEATLTLTLYDSNDNLITGKANGLTVTPTGSIAGDMTISAFVEDINNHGVYTATITGENVGEVTLHSYLNSVLVSNDMPYLSVYSYTFSLNNADFKLVVGGKRQLKVVATPSDGGLLEEFSTNVTWKSTNNNVASIDSRGMANGVGQGSSEISGEGDHKLIPFSVKGTVNVLDVIISPEYGHYYVQYDDDNGRVDIYPKTTKMSVRSGNAIDSLGGFGGDGGTTVTEIENLDKLTSIHVFTGEYARDVISWKEGGIVGLVFTYKDGRSITYGSVNNSDVITIIDDYVFHIPDDYKLQYVSVKAQRYVHFLQFVIYPDI